MPSQHTIAAFAAASIAILVIPGPSVMFVVTRAVAYGRRAAFLTVVGNAGGAFTQMVLVAVGLGQVIERSVAVFTAIKLVGAAYLVFMGVQTIRQRRALVAVVDATGSVRPPRALLRDGYVVGVANPKLAVFAAAILPQFVERGHGPAGVQMVVLGLVFVLIALVSDGAWGMGAGTARRWLARSPRRMEHLSGLGGLVIIGLGLRLAASGRSS
jgi:threonine/homoserine/homoserine lactone efflux protein